MFIFKNSLYSRQALQAPKEEEETPPFEEWEDDLNDYIDKANMISGELFAALQDDPEYNLANLEMLLENVDKIFVLHDANYLDEWAAYVGEIGTELVQSSNDAQELLEDTVQALKSMRLWNEYLAAEFAKTKDSRYTDLIEIVYETVQELTQTQVRYEG